MRAGGVTAADVFLLSSELPPLHREREKGGEKETRMPTI